MEVECLPPGDSFDLSLFVLWKGPQIPWIVYKYYAFEKEEDIPDGRSFSDALSTYCE